MKYKVVKLGTECKDIATGLTGTLKNWTMDMGGHVLYLFQPKGLTDEGLPLPKIYFEPERLNLKEDSYEEVEVPFNVLGTQVTDKASGFTGMAVLFMRHINGCFHVYIQPHGINEKTKAPVKKCDFDLRSCTGEMIEKMTNEELRISKQENPSPEGDSLSFDLNIQTTSIDNRI